MRIGYQTAIWGTEFDDYKKAFDAIAAAGFKGIELAQHPKLLKNIDFIIQALEERNLTFIGMTRGSLKERVSFCNNHRPEFLYIEKWESEADDIVDNLNFTLALHLHAFKLIRRLEDVREELDSHPKLQFLLDTAHLQIAGHDIIKAIDEFHPRLIGIHLKDWSSLYGTSSYRYARGITSLGKGLVPICEVMKKLENIEFNGWVIVESDTPVEDPYSYVYENALWLYNKKYFEKEPNKISVDVQKENSGLVIGRKNNSPYYKREEFLHSLLRSSSKGVPECYSHIANSIRELTLCKQVTLWSWDSQHDRMIFTASSPKVELSDYVLQRSNAVSGKVVDERRVTHFNFKNIEGAFPNKKLIQELNIDRMVSIPIFNVGTYNHIRTIINILFSPDDKISTSDEEFLEVSKDISYALDYALNELDSFSKTKVSLISSKHNNIKKFTKDLIHLIKDTLNCEAVAFFLKKEDRTDRLELIDSTGTKWVPDREKQYYVKNEGLTGKAWARNDVIITKNAWRGPKNARKSYELVSKSDSTLIAPITDNNNETVGIVRCHNKMLVSSENFSMFSYDDVAALDSIFRTALPYFQLLRNRNFHIRTIRRMSHELKNPLNAIRGAADLMKSEFINRSINPSNFFGYDFIQDIWEWSDLMHLLIRNAEFFRYTSDTIQVRPARTFLMKDIIAPTVRQIGPFLKMYDLRYEQISYNDFSEIPPLWIDKDQFRQVFFNLLTNSIKHSYNDSRSFQVEIIGTRANSSYLVQYNDWGPGVRQGMEEAIFEEGVRDSDAYTRDTSGQGIGLWIVRQVIEAHRGQIWLHSRHLPTSFMIRLPLSLSSPTQTRR
jgi:signal transduction histidine kinase/sugar phosphate isomerase/epimerase